MIDNVEGAAAVGAVAKVQRVFDVPSSDVCRWVGVSVEQLESYAAGPVDPVSLPGQRLAALLRLADAFAESLLPAAIRAVFSTRPVPLLGGLTYRGALDDGWNADVLVDVLRHGAGRQAQSDVAARYLAGPLPDAALAQGSGQ